jgi:putative tricarboxylic transport membrane protein
MSEETKPAAESGPPHRSVEIGVALLTLVFGSLVLIGSMRVGIDWGIEGPRPGFFPFYISLFIIGASLVNLLQVWNPAVSGTGPFSSWGQLRQVFSVILPACAYVALVSILGMYVSSMLLIAVFMMWIGGYDWRMTAPISIGVPAFAYIVFERWFLIPLPKGPVEELLGL